MREEITTSVPTVRKVRFYHKNSLFIPFIFLISLLSIWVGLWQVRMPDVVSQGAGKESFSAERAMEQLEEIAIKPRPVGSLEHDRVRDYLVTSLNEIGIQANIQVATENLSVWGVPYEGKVENVVARIDGSNPSGAIMITSHYDSDTISPGAADAGSAVVAILETVRALTESQPLKNDVIILLSDGEEIGLLGAQAFVQEHPWAQEVDIVLNFEARGSSGPSVMFETNEQNERIIAELAKGASHPIAHSFIVDVYNTLPNDTDLSVYKSSGMYGLNFGFFIGLHGYHTPEDTVENLNINSLQHHGHNMLELVRHFGNMELVAAADGNSLYFNMIGNKVVTYSEKLVLPLMFLCLIIFLMTVIHGLIRKKLTIPGTAIGFVIFVLSVILAYFAGESLLAILSIVTGLDLWTIGAYPRISHPTFIGILSLFFILMMAIYHFILKRVNARDMTMGGLMGWLLLVCVSSISFQSSSYVFVWPFLIGLSGLNLLMYVRDDWRITGKILSLCMMVLPMVFIAPVIYLAYALLTLQEVGMLTASASLLIVFMIPVLHQVRKA